MINPLTIPWGATAALRVQAYRRGWLPVHRLDRPVVSVGALEMGGTGKTPVAAGVARILHDAGLRTAILSRGYRRRGNGPLLVSAGSGLEVPVRQAGDEPCWYVRVLDGVIVAVGARREQAAACCHASGPDVYVLDDAFQHVRVARDVNLLVVDSDRPFYVSSPPPLGRLRELPSAARRASGFAVHGDAVGLVDAELQRRYPGRPIFRFERSFPAPVPLPQYRGESPESEPDVLQPTLPVFAFAGIAHPRRVFCAIESAAHLVGHRRFADHHWYTLADMRKIDTAARSAGAQALVTTEKDAVRLASLPSAGLPVWVWRYRLEAADPDGLSAWLQRHLRAAA